MISPGVIMGPHEARDVHRRWPGGRSTGCRSSSGSTSSTSSSSSRTGRAQSCCESLDLDPEEDTLLGFYDGVPVGERSHSSDLPEPVTDTIYLFQGALEEACESEAELVEEIRVTLLHEIGHHFGLDDDEIEKLGYG